MNYPGRIIKIGESDTAVVKFLAAGLVARGYAVTSPPGVFDATFRSLVKLYQSQNVDAGGRPLEADGKVGSMTWGSLFPTPVVAATGGGIATAALGIAITQLGVMEEPLGSNSGPKVKEFLASVGLPAGNFWCMAFVFWCFKKAAEQSGQANPFPKTGGCLDAWNKVKSAHPGKIITRAAALANPGLVKPGHVFILDHGGGHGHTGFVRQSLQGPLRTIEGNTAQNGSSNGVGVFELNRRKIPDPTLKGFIDFT